MSMKRVWRSMVLEAVGTAEAYGTIEAPDWDGYIGCLSATGTTAGSVVAPESFGVQLKAPDGAELHQVVMPAAMVATPGDNLAGPAWLWLKVGAGAKCKVVAQQLTGSTPIGRVDVGVLFVTELPR